MRGKAEAMSFLGINNGITPAHAGKSRHFQEVTRIEEDHPRTCGEK